MKIDIKGVIVSNDDKWIYDWLEMDATAPKDVNAKLTEANGADVELNINSGGGDVYAGVEIYTLLKDYAGKTTAKITGLAASAASIIAMGAQKLLMSPAGQLMIHKAQVRASGNHNYMEHVVEVLKSHDEGIANAYMLKTGMSQDKLLELMDKETYFSAQSACAEKYVSLSINSKSLS